MAGRCWKGGVPLPPEVCASPPHYLLHELAELVAAQVAGAGALDGDDGRAEAFAVGGLRRGVNLPTLVGALEEGLWDRGGDTSGSPRVMEPPTHLPQVPQTQRHLSTTPERPSWCREEPTRPFPTSPGR